MFLTVECVASESSTTATPNMYLAIWKNLGGNITIGDLNLIGGTDMKNLVIHQEMVMINAVDGGVPRNLFKGVIVIPRGMRRMAPNDIWNLSVWCPTTGVATNVCAQAHYKEFR